MSGVASAHIYIYIYIVHPESFRSNVQNAITFARRNRPRIICSNVFECVYLCLRVMFAIEHAYVHIYVRAQHEVHLKSIVIGSCKIVLCTPSAPYSAASAELEETFVHGELFDNRKLSAVTMLYKLCPCCAGYVIVTNAVTLTPTQG